MKKFWLMFAFVLCGALAFTSCDKDENEIKPGGDNNQEQPEGDWKAGLDESKAPNQLTLRIEVAGAKQTWVADFEGGVCTKCIVTTVYQGYKDVQDYSAQYKGLEYEVVKAAFQAVVDASK